MSALVILCYRSHDVSVLLCFFFFQAEDGIRDAQESRGLGDVYKRQRLSRRSPSRSDGTTTAATRLIQMPGRPFAPATGTCLLYTSDAADDLLCVDLGGRRIIKKKTNYFSPNNINYQSSYNYFR